MKIERNFIIAFTFAFFSFQLRADGLDRFKSWYADFIQKETIIIDSEGKGITPTFPEDTKTTSPFGLFFRIVWEGKDGYQQGVCNLTHLIRKKAITASHCLKKLENLPDPFFALLYFDKKGDRHFRYIPRERIVDLPQYQTAILDLEEVVDNEWNTLGLEYFDYPKEKIDKIPRQTFKTFLYVFDSVQNDPEVLKKLKEGTQGSIFRKKELIGSRTPIRVARIRKGEKGYFEIPLLASGKTRFFLDYDSNEMASSPPTSGNSGALALTMEGNQIKIVGLLDGIMRESDFWKARDPLDRGKEADTYFYVGNSATLPPQNESPEISNWLLLKRLGENNQGAKFLFATGVVFSNKDWLSEKSKIVREMEISSIHFNFLNGFDPP